MCCNIIISIAVLAIWGLILNKILDNSIFKHIEYYKLLTDEQKKKFSLFTRSDIDKINKKDILLKGLFLIPLRIISFIILAISGYLALKILTFYYGVKDLEKEQSEEFKYKTRKVAQFILKAIIIMMGFKVTNKLIKTENPSSKKERDECKLIVSNHVTLFDIFVYLSTSINPCFISNISIKQIPFISYYSEVIQSIFVNRFDPIEKKKIFKVLEDRITNYKNGKNYSPMIVFPEGTTKKFDYLIPFKKGAFIYDIPIKMIVLDYTKNEINPQFTIFDQIGCFMLICCNLINYITINEIDGLLYPKNYKNEKNEIDWVKMSEDCRTIMANSVGFKKFECEDVYKLIQEFKVVKKDLLNKLLKTKQKNN